MELASLFAPSGIQLAFCFLYIFIQRFHGVVHKVVLIMQRGPVRTAFQLLLSFPFKLLVYCDNVWVEVLNDPFLKRFDQFKVFHWAIKPFIQNNNGPSLLASTPKALTKLNRILQMVVTNDDVGGRDIKSLFRNMIMEDVMYVRKYRAWHKQANTLPSE